MSYDNPKWIRHLRQRPPEIQALLEQHLKNEARLRDLEAEMGAAIVAQRRTRRELQLLVEARWSRAQILAAQRVEAPADPGHSMGLADRRDTAQLIEDLAHTTADGFLEFADDDDPTPEQEDFDWAASELGRPLTAAERRKFVAAFKAHYKARLPAARSRPARGDGDGP